MQNTYQNHAIVLCYFDCGYLPRGSETHISGHAGYKQKHELWGIYQTLSVLDYITISKDTLFVTSESDGSVYKIDLHEGTSPKDAIITSFTGKGEAHVVVIDPTGTLAYVTRSEANTVDVFDPNTLTPIKHIPVADDPDGIFYDPGSKQIYVASGDAKLATLIDPTKQETVATIHFTGKPEFATFDSQSGLFYQNLEDTNAVAAVNTITKSVVQEWQLPGCKAPSAMASIPLTGAFHWMMGNSRLLVFDLDEGYRNLANRLRILL